MTALPAPITVVLLVAAAIFGGAAAIILLVFAALNELALAALRAPSPEPDGER